MDSGQLTKLTQLGDQHRAADIVINTMVGKYNNDLLAAQAVKNINAGSKSELPGNRDLLSYADGAFIATFQLNQRGLDDFANIKKNVSSGLVAFYCGNDLNFRLGRALGIGLKVIYRTPDGTALDKTEVAPDGCGRGGAE